MAIRGVSSGEITPFDDYANKNRARLFDVLASELTGVSQETQRHVVSQLKALKASGVREENVYNWVMNLKRAIPQSGANNIDTAVRKALDNVVENHNLIHQSIEQLATAFNDQTRRASSALVQGVHGRINKAPRSARKVVAKDTTPAQASLEARVAGLFADSSSAEATELISKINILSSDNKAHLYAILPETIADAERTDIISKLGSLLDKLVAFGYASGGENANRSLNGLRYFSLDQATAFLSDFEALLPSQYSAAGSALRGSALSHFSDALEKGGEGFIQNLANSLNALITENKAQSSNLNTLFLVSFSKGQWQDFAMIDYFMQFYQNKGIYEAQGRSFDQAYRSFLTADRVSFMRDFVNLNLPAALHAPLKEGLLSLVDVQAAQSRRLIQALTSNNIFTLEDRQLLTAGLARHSETVYPQLQEVRDALNDSRLHEIERPRLQARLDRNADGDILAHLERYMNILSDPRLSNARSSILKAYHYGSELGKIEFPTVLDRIDSLFVSGIDLSQPVNIELQENAFRLIDNFQDPFVGLDKPEDLSRVSNQLRDFLLSMQDLRNDAASFDNSVDTFFHKTIKILADTEPPLPSLQQANEIMRLIKDNMSQWDDYSTSRIEQFDQFITTVLSSNNENKLDAVSDTLERMSVLGALNMPTSADASFVHTLRNLSDDTFMEFKDDLLGMNSQSMREALIQFVVNSPLVLADTSYLLELPRVFSEFQPQSLALKLAQLFSDGQMTDGSIHALMSHLESLSTENRAVVDELLPNITDTNRAQLSESLSSLMARLHQLDFTNSDAAHHSSSLTALTHLDLSEASKLLKDFYDIQPAGAAINTVNDQNFMVNLVRVLANDDQGQIKQFAKDMGEIAALVSSLGEHQGRAKEYVGVFLNEMTDDVAVTMLSAFKNYISHLDESQNPPVNFYATDPTVGTPALRDFIQQQKPSYEWLSNLAVDLPTKSRLLEGMSVDPVNKQNEAWQLVGLLRGTDNSPSVFTPIDANYLLNGISKTNDISRFSDVIALGDLLKSSALNSVRSSLIAQHANSPTMMEDISKGALEAIFKEMIQSNPNAFPNLKPQYIDTLAQTGAQSLWNKYQANPATGLNGFINGVFDQLKVDAKWVHIPQHVQQQWMGWFETNGLLPASPIAKADFRDKLMRLLSPLSLLNRTHLSNQFAILKRQFDNPNTKFPGQFTSVEALSMINKFSQIVEETMGNVGISRSITSMRRDSSSPVYEYQGKSLGYEEMIQQRKLQRVLGVNIRRLDVPGQGNMIMAKLVRDPMAFSSYFNVPGTLQALTRKGESIPEGFVLSTSENTTGTSGPSMTPEERNAAADAAYARAQAHNAAHGTDDDPEPINPAKEKLLAAMGASLMKELFNFSHIPMNSSDPDVMTYAKTMTRLSSAVEKLSGSEIFEVFSYIGHKKFDPNNEERWNLIENWKTERERVQQEQAEAAREAAEEAKMNDFIRNFSSVPAASFTHLFAQVRKLGTLDPFLTKLETKLSSMTAVDQASYVENLKKVISPAVVQNLLSDSRIFTGTLDALSERSRDLSPLLEWSDQAITTFATLGDGLRTDLLRRAVIEPSGFQNLGVHSHFFANSGSTDESIRESFMYLAAALQLNANPQIRSLRADENIIGNKFNGFGLDGDQKTTFENALRSLTSEHQNQALRLMQFTSPMAVLPWIQTPTIETLNKLFRLPIDQQAAIVNNFLVGGNHFIAKIDHAVFTRRIGLIDIMVGDSASQLIWKATDDNDDMASHLFDNDVLNRRVNKHGTAVVDAFLSFSPELRNKMFPILDSGARTEGLLVFLNQAKEMNESDLNDLLDNFSSSSGLKNFEIRGFIDQLEFLNDAGRWEDSYGKKRRELPLRTDNIQDFANFVEGYLSFVRNNPSNRADIWRLYVSITQEGLHSHRDELRDYNLSNDQPTKYDYWEGEDGGRVSVHSNDVPHRVLGRTFQHLNIFLNHKHLQDKTDEGLRKAIYQLATNDPRDTTLPFWGLLEMYGDGDLTWFKGEEDDEEDDGFDNPWAATDTP